MTVNTFSRKVPWIEEEEDRVWNDDDAYSNWDFADDADDASDNDNSDDFGVDDEIDEDSIVWGGYDKLADRDSSDDDDEDYTFDEGPSWKNLRLDSYKKGADRDHMGYLEKPSRVNRKRFSNKRRRR